MVELYDKNGIPQVNMNAINRTGTPSFQVIDSSGKTRASLGLSEDQAPAFVLRDAKERVRSMYGLSEDGDPALLFYDEKNKAEWLAPPEAK